jgi:hypothetical protein
MNPVSRTPASGPFLRLFLHAALVLGAAVPAAASEWTWLPRSVSTPRALADPLEPRTGLTAVLDETRFDAALGGPLPLVRGRIASHPFVLVLETAGRFTLGRDGAFFPVETFDGVLGMGAEIAGGRWRTRLRAVHWSAHQADGDSTVGFRARTFSREFWDVQIGRLWGRAGFAYARIGWSWHAVPRDRGPRLAAGARWENGHGFPFIAAYHIEADRERSWRATNSLIAGAALYGERTLVLGLRYLRGFDPRGQYERSPVEYVGVEIQYGMPAGKK